jgi:hypothetical protein
VYSVIFQTDLKYHITQKNFSVSASCEHQRKGAGLAKLYYTYFALIMCIFPAIV